MPLAPAEQGGRDVRRRDDRRAAWASRSPRESAAWGDFDNDGRIDLFVCGEYSAPAGRRRRATHSARPDPRNRCRLYRNHGDGTFVDVADDGRGPERALRARGSAWGDYDGDGWLDLTSPTWAAAADSTTTTATAPSPTSPPRWA